MILLYHEDTTHGMIATSSKQVAGESHPPRRYHHNGHFVEIDGQAHVVSHDAEEICKIAGYRLATPAEQEEYAASKKKKTSVKEGDK